MPVGVLSCLGTRHPKTKTQDAHLNAIPALSRKQVPVRYLDLRSAVCPCVRLRPDCRCSHGNQKSDEDEKNCCYIVCADRIPYLRARGTGKPTSPSLTASKPHRIATGQDFNTL